jgi:hypothetical protein
MKSEVEYPYWYYYGAISFNRLMMVRLIHFGLLGFCGILVSFASFIMRHAFKEEPESG